MGGAIVAPVGGEPGTHCRLVGGHHLVPDPGIDLARRPQGIGDEILIAQIEEPVLSNASAGFEQPVHQPRQTLRPVRAQFHGIDFVGLHGLQRIAHAAE